MKFKQFAKKQAGMTLMELIASLSVMAVVVVGALALYNSANSSEQSTSLSKDLHAVRAATQHIFQGQGSYGVAGTNLNDILVSANKIPTSIRVDSATTPDTLTHKANGTVNVASTGTSGTSFAITMTNIPIDVCIPLMSQSTGGWTSIKAGTAAERTTFPITPTVAEADCKTGTTMVFTAS